MPIFLSKEIKQFSKPEIDCWVREYFLETSKACSLSNCEGGSWLKILNEVENSVLWILKTNDVAADNLKKEAKKAGVDPKRVIFAEKLTNKEHLKSHDVASIL